MKVLHVTTHMNIGGIGNYILSLSYALKEKGIDVIVASSGGNLEEELRLCGIEHFNLNIKTKFEFSPKVFISAVRLSNLIRKENIDIVHCHTRVSQVAGLIASRIARAPYLTTCHGFFKKRLRGVFDTWGEKVIAISTSVKNHLENDLGVSPDRIRTVYSGIDLRRFSRTYSTEDISRIKKSFGLKDGYIIGTIGRLSSVKGHEFLVRAMVEVLKEDKTAECLIVGDGDEKRALKSLVKSLGLDRNIHFIGSDLDTGKFLSVMDIFVFPSVKEGLGISLLEAMASGKACIASEIGGIRDIITDGFNGILVPVGDYNAISKAILRAIKDKELRKRLAGNAKDLICERFSIDKMSGNVINVYKEVLNAGGRDRGQHL